MTNYECLFHLLNVKFPQKALKSFVVWIHSIYIAFFGYVLPSGSILIIVSFTGLFSTKNRKIQVISWARHESQIIEGLDLEVLVPFWFVLCSECLELVRHPIIEHLCVKHQLLCSDHSWRWLVVSVYFWNVLPHLHLGIEPSFQSGIYNRILKSKETLEILISPVFYI